MAEDYTPPWTLLDEFKFLSDVIGRRGVKFAAAYFDALILRHFDFEGRPMPSEAREMLANFLIRTIKGSPRNVKTKS